jgi:hypothetical protein
MTTEEIIAELRSCLALQKEIFDKQVELALRFKAVLRDESTKGTSVVVRIDGDLYQLLRLDVATDEMREQLDICRKTGGFYGDYRLVKSGKVYE